MKPASTVSTHTLSSAEANFASASLPSSLARCAKAARPGEDGGDRVGRRVLALLVLAVVARHRAVRGLGFDRLAVGRHQHARHQAERAEALRDGVGLHVAVVVLARPHVAARPLQGGGDHVVDQAVLVGELALLELVLELGVEHLLEQVLEAAVVGLEDGVLGRQVDRIVAVEPVVEGGARELADLSRRDCTWRCATPLPGALNTSRSITLPSSPTNLMVSVPLPGNLKSVARYWSP